MKVEQVLQLIQAVSDSELTEFKYEEDGVKLSLKKTEGKIVQVQTPVAAPAVVQAAPAVIPAAPVAAAPAAPATEAARSRRGIRSGDGRCASDRKYCKISSGWNFLRSSG